MSGGIRAVQTRCLVTGNPVGTDTWQAGNPCRCANCSKTATAVIGGTTREICYRCQHSSGGCNGACRPSSPLSHWSLSSAPQPKGCICPPAANLTCQRPDCGRKPAPAAPIAEVGAKAFADGAASGGRAS